jgi:hypothetical protein
LLCNVCSIFSQVVEPAAAALKDGKTIAFYEPPAGPFYKVKSGDQSPWGHELIPLLRTAAAAQSIDAADYAAACHKYHVDGKDTIPYVNSALREAHAAIEAGKSWQDAATDDTQAHGMGKVSVRHFALLFRAKFSDPGAAKCIGPTRCHLLCLSAFERALSEHLLVFQV